MASRIIHLAICKQLEKSMKLIKNANRLRIGQILPDAIIRGEDAHAASHFKKNACEGKKWFIDFLSFHKQFSNIILKDDLYLGYYFHLIEDAIFRKLLYYDYQLCDKRGPEFREALHNDYSALNGYLIRKYELTDGMDVPLHFKKEEINKVYPFVLDEFLLEMSKDFNYTTCEKTKYFTESMVEEYINKCVIACKEELKAIQNGKTFLNPSDYAWDR